MRFFRNYIFPIALGLGTGVGVVLFRFELSAWSDTRVRAIGSGGYATRIQ